MNHETLARFARDEDRLLIACTGPWSDGEIASPVRDLLDREMDWSQVIGTAMRHGVLPLLYRRLHSIGSDLLPQDLWSQLQRHFLANSAHNHFLTSELVRILDGLDSGGIAAAPLKGPVLARLAYGDVALRQFEDLDILIHKSDALSVRELLHALGYIDEFRSELDAPKALLKYQQHFSLLAPTHGSSVELHWTLEQGRNWTRFSNTDVWDRLISLDLDGSAVGALSPEDQILYLCVHGASHCWDRLLWVCDVAWLLSAPEELDWDSLTAQATNLHRKRMLLLGVGLTHNLLGAKLPERIARMADECSNVAHLVNTAMHNMFKSNRDSPGLKSTFFFRFAARETIADKIRFCFRRLVVPDAIDLNSVRLPSRLSFLYFLIRPIRLASKGILGSLARMKGKST